MNLVERKKIMPNLNIKENNRLYPILLNKFIMTKFNNNIKNLKFKTSSNTQKMINSMMNGINTKFSKKKQKTKKDNL